MNVNNLLAIGSVVLLKDANKKLMITGILQKNEETTYDYIGVLYPEGYIDAQTMFLFNHSDIVEICYLGFMGAEHQVFRNDLNNVLEGKQAAIGWQQEQ